MTVIGAAAALTIVGKVLDVPLAVALLFVAVYPFVLWALRFYLPAELSAIRGRAARSMP
jgi:hypothetical protein